MKNSLISLLVLFSSLNFLKSQSSCISSFTESESPYVLGGQADIASADFNNDGKIDLATLNPGGHISLLFGTSTGTFTNPTNFSSQLISPYQLKSADFNNDGNMDLVLTNAGLYGPQNSNSHILTMLLGNGTGGFSTPINFTVAPNSKRLIVQDFNNDGKADLAVSNETDIKVLLGQGNGSFSAPATFTTIGNPLHMTSGDFNADSKMDLAVSTQSNSFAVLLGTGTGSFSTPIVTSHSSTALSFWTIKSGDFNKDGIPDIAVTTANTPTYNLLTYIGTGTGNFTLTSSSSLAYIPSDMLIGDFNIDGSLDLVLTFINAGVSHVKLNNNFGQFTYSSTYSLTSPHWGIAGGDFNMDGKPDFAVSNWSSQNSISVYTNITDIPSLTITATPSITCPGEPVILIATGASSYTWNTTETLSAIAITPSATTSYTLTGGGITGCQRSAAISINVQACTGVDLQNLEESAIQLFPNPGQGLFHLDMKNFTNESSFEISNMIGQIIHKGKLESKSITFDISNQPAGIYILKFSYSREQNKILKIIKN